MAEVAVAEVWLWDRLVGAVAETGDGRVAFEYSGDFRRDGWEISPVHLPRSRSGVFEFPELGRIEAFEGLPGVLADALPDRFGNAVIRRYFEGRGEPARLGPVQKLLYVGDRAMGALRFRPALDLPHTAAEEEALHLVELVADARRVVEGDPDVAIPEMMRLGASAGGARPKAVVLRNPGTGRIRSAFAASEAGDEHWMIKFDGVGDLDHPERAARPYNRVEYAYHRLALAAGIEMALCELVIDGPLAHFATRRFDRNVEPAPHMHSFGGLVHVDFNQPGLTGYDVLLRQVLALTGSDGQVAEAFRRMVFNVLAVNQDDHVKNVAFLLRPTEGWTLAPAYDLTYARGRGYTQLHQMDVNGTRADPTVADLVAVGRRFGLRASGQPIVDEVMAALDRWPDEARGVGVPEDWIQRIADQHQSRHASS